jgi:putative protein-disulfide isomerase
MNLVYVADPMCSWCYGFAPALDALLESPRGEQPPTLSLVMGGLRPYTSEPLSAAKADEIFEHWRHVHEASGQPFAPAPHTALHRIGFVYDTEPASRAAVTVRSRWPQLAWAFFKTVQQAFYADAKDVTQRSVLADLAQHQGIARAEFEAAFDSDAMRNATRRDFAQSQAWGVRGFPTLLVEQGSTLQVICHGYCGAGALQQRLTAVLAGVN